MTGTPWATASRTVVSSPFLSRAGELGALCNCFFHIVYTFSE